MISPPQPSPTHTPTPTGTSPPTHSPTPTATPTPTESQITPSPTSSPTPTPTFSPSPTPTSTPSEEIYEVENLRNLLELAQEMSYRWMDSNGTQTDITYKVTGEETVEGATCWIMEASLETEGDETMLKVWISQDDGTAKKVVIEDQEFTGDMAEMIWEAYGSLLMWPFLMGSPMNLWEIHYVTDPTYGTVQHVGSEVHIYGETQLTVNKYRFQAGPAWYDPELGSFDYWLADVGPYMLMTYFKYTFQNGEWGSFELLAIRL